MTETQKPAPADKEARLAERLRENLRRRKAAAPKTAAEPAPKEAR